MDLKTWTKQDGGIMPNYISSVSVQNLVVARCCVCCLIEILCLECRGSSQS